MNLHSYVSFSFLLFFHLLLLISALYQAPEQSYNNIIPLIKTLINPFTDLFHVSLMNNFLWMMRRRQDGRAIKHLNEQ